MTTQQDDSNSNAILGPERRLEVLLSQSGNRICADCGSPDPKWVSLSFGVFICIKCSGVHRSFGVHISKVLSVKLDEWTDEEVDSLEGMGGNAAINVMYEAYLPENCKKPKPDSPIEERSDFIRRKYEQQQFLNSNVHLASSPHVSTSSSSLTSASQKTTSGNSDKKPHEKQNTSNHFHGLGHAFRNSWRRKEDHKAIAQRKSNMGMVEFIGLIKVNVVRGTNLAVRDVKTSDPYVVLTLGHQLMKTRVIKKNLNPVWNESIMLSIPESVPPLKLQVFDKDRYSTDDRMGEAEIDIQPLVSATKAYESSIITESTQLEEWLANEENTLVKDGVIHLLEGKVKQEITVRLQHVERGELEIELEYVPLSQ